MIASQRSPTASGWWDLYVGLAPVGEVGET
jgi:hypothetical protein